MHHKPVVAVPWLAIGIGAVIWGCIGLVVWGFA